MKSQYTITQLDQKLDHLIKRNVKWFSTYFPNLDLPDSISVNTRLSKCLGVCKISRYSVDIEISKSLLLYYNEFEQDDIFRHELIHYGLFMQNKPHGDNDKEFIDTCNILGVSLSNIYKYRGKSQVYKCNCKLHYFHRRIINFKNNKSHRCKLCKTHLIYEGETIITC